MVKLLKLIASYSLLLSKMDAKNHSALIIDKNRSNTLEQKNVSALRWSTQPLSKTNTTESFSLFYSGNGLVSAAEFHSMQINNEDNAIFAVGQVGDVMLITKVDKQGQMQWAKGHYAAPRLKPNSVAVDNGEALFVTGAAFNKEILNGSFFAANQSLFISKFDHSGNPLWFYSLEQQPEASYGTAIELSDQQNSVVVTGYINTSDFCSDALLTKLESTYGSMVWLNKLNFSSCSFGQSMLNGDDDSLLILGNTYGLSHSENQRDLDNTSDGFFVAKFTENGTLQWANSLFHQSLSAQGYAMTKDNKGGLLVAGS